LPEVWLILGPDSLAYFFCLGAFIFASQKQKGQTRFSVCPLTYLQGTATNAAPKTQYQTYRVPFTVYFDERESVCNPIARNPYLLTVYVGFASRSTSYPETCGSQENLSLSRALSEKPKLLEIRVSMPIRQDAWQEPWNRSYSKGSFFWRARKR